jgi:hypothetical protein
VQTLRLRLTIVPRPIKGPLGLGFSKLRARLAALSFPNYTIAQPPAADELVLDYDFFSADFLSPDFFAAGVGFLISPQAT